MQIIDDFLSDEDYENISSSILNEWFPWYRNSSVVYNPDTTVAGPTEVKNFKPEYKTEKKYLYQFGHRFYDNYNVNSDFFDLLRPLLERLNPSALVRIKANLNPVTNEHMFYDMGHKDISGFSGKSAIYYLNTNNGYTLFEDGAKVDCVANRILIFDSHLLHTGITCTDKSYRCVINLNYYEWE